jgi:DNA-binding beta-propeller fold protein YncE
VASRLTGLGRTDKGSGPTSLLVLLPLLLLSGCGTGRDAAAHLPLRLVRDVPLSASAVRYDYQDVDAGARRLYVAHLGASEVDVFDLDALRPVGAVRGVADVHGVRVAPDLHRLFATATGTDEVVTIDTDSLQVVGRAPTGHFPDGLAYDPSSHLLAVSNKNDGSETVVDARTGRRVRTVPLSQEAGNVTDDPTTGTMLAAARPPDELAVFDAASGNVGGRIPLPGCHGAHGVSVDPPARRAYVACEDNARLAVVDLAARRELSLQKVGSDPDVLALDAGLGRLYVAAESGDVTVFAVDGQGVRTLGRDHLAARAHSVAVDPPTHHVFFPLENLGGHPVLRVMQP